MSYNYCIARVAVVIATAPGSKYRGFESRQGYKVLGVNICRSLRCSIYFHFVNVLGLAEGVNFINPFWPEFKKLHMYGCNIFTRSILRNFRPKRFTFTCKIVKLTPRVLAPMEITENYKMHLWVTLSKGYRLRMKFGWAAFGAIFHKLFLSR
jgi:hypothetical protein